MSMDDTKVKKVLKGSEDMQNEVATFVSESVADEPQTGESPVEPEVRDTNPMTDVEKAIKTSEELNTAADSVGEKDQWDPLTKEQAKEVVKVVAGEDAPENKPTGDPGEEEVRKAIKFFERDDEKPAAAD